MPEAYEHHRYASNSVSLNPEIEAELLELIDRYLDDTPRPDQLARLEHLVTEHRAAAIIYYTLVHLWCVVPLHLAQSAIDLSADDQSLPTAPTSMDEAMMLPAIREDHIEDMDSPKELLSPARLMPFVQPARNPGRFLRWGRWAAIVLLVSGLSFAIWRHTTNGTNARTASADSPATVTATAGAIFEGGSKNAPGSRLAIGDSMHLFQGAVELTFKDGAVVVVKGPARLRISERNAIALSEGAMTADVPVAARGFRVDAPGLSAVDRGTDFGVRILDTKASSEVHVFKGIVDVTGLDAAGNPVATPLRVIAGQACQHSEQDTTAPTAVTYSPEGFKRDIATIRQPLPLHNTGDQLAPGNSDPDWRIESAPDSLNWKPQSAVVVTNPRYPNQPNTSDGKWISTDAAASPSPPGLYVFATSVDMTGFDPSTATVQVHVTADDCIADIRINGVSTRLVTPTADENVDYVQTTLEIPGGNWRQGLNKIEVIVRNLNFHLNAAKETPLGLQLLWSGSACPVVQR